jgi:hypothetical protein
MEKKLVRTLCTANSCNVKIRHQFILAITFCVVCGTESILAITFCVVCGTKSILAITFDPRGPDRNGNPYPMCALGKLGVLSLNLARLTDAGPPSAAQILNIRLDSLLISAL